MMPTLIDFFAKFQPTFYVRVIRHEAREMVESLRASVIPDPYITEIDYVRTAAGRLDLP
jgi:hypothetical protein